MKRFFVFVVLALLCTPSEIFAQTGTVFAFDLRTRDNFVTFSADDPSSLNFINKNVSPFAMDFDTSGTTLYAVDSNTATLGTLDQATGLFTSVAALTGDYAGGTVTGLSADPTDGSFYMSTATDLFSLNIVSGATVSLGTFTNSVVLGPAVGTVIDIAIDSSGQMYAHELDPAGGDLQIQGGLWSVDKSNAVATFIGSSGLESLFAQGMDFDPDSDVLYAAIYTGGGTGSYGTWDTSDASFTEILDLPSFGAVELEIAISDGVTYAYDFRGQDQFLTFPLNTPVPFISDVDIIVYASFAMDFDADGSNLVLFDNNTATFGTIDPDNGCFTPGAAISGDLVGNPGGLSCDPTTGMFWAVGGGVNGDELYLVDLVTGQTTFVSAIVDVLGAGIGGIVDIAFDNDGNLYAFDIGGDVLYSVDPMSGATTFVGQPGGDANFAQGMDFDPVSNVLYQSVYTGGGTGSYGSWDLDTGTFTEILPLPMFEDPIGTGYEFEMAIRGEAGGLLGDVNCDGVVDLLDINPFVNLITTGGFSAKADINGDGAVDLLDVAPFVAILTGG